MKYIEYKEQRTQGTFNFPIAYYHVTPRSPRYIMQLHWHTEYEIIRILSGELELSLNDDIKTYKKGDVIFVTDGVLHGGTPNDCVYECIVFDLKILLKDNHACTKTIQDIINHRITVNSLLTENNEKILPVVKNLFHALSRKKVAYEFMTQGYLYQLLGIIVQEHLYSEQALGDIPPERLEPIKNVLEYIEKNYSNNISLDQLAREAGMNPKYFCRYFKGMTGRTPVDYLNYYRIECACEMLSTQDLSVKETSISCGFNDESYFIKTFHKYKNVTPKQYIKVEF